MDVVRHVEGDSFQTRKVTLCYSSSLSHVPCFIPGSRGPNRTERERGRERGREREKQAHDWASRTFRTSATHRSGLGLGDEIAAQDGGPDGPLLDGGGLLETVGVDATEELLGKFHAVEGLDGLVPVGVDVGIVQALSGTLAPVAALALGGGGLVAARLGKKGKGGKLRW